MIQLASKLATSSANENESWTVNSLTVKGDKIGTKNFSRLCVGVLIAESQKDISLLELLNTLV